MLPVLIADLIDAFGPDFAYHANVVRFVPLFLAGYMIAKAPIGRRQRPFELEH